MRHPILYGLPHGILHVFNTILYENEFQNPQILKVPSKLLLSCLTIDDPHYSRNANAHLQ
jgi:hypothetical protein